MADHVFISYNRADQAYTRALAKDLRRQGLEPWIDDRINPGQRWWHTVVHALRASAAVVVVMTPESEESEWVEREIQLALNRKIPIYPLLLRGEGIPLLVTTQHVDVSDGQMPQQGFYDELRQVLGLEGGSTPQPEPVSQPAPAPHASVPMPEMIRIPAGEFWMGSDPARDSQAEDDEKPYHKLFLPDYSIARTPVTNAQYRAFVQAAGHRLPEHWVDGQIPRDKETHPVVYVNWHDAQAYCDWLATATGKPLRLPGEAEWEKAARGTQGSIYPWGDEWDASLCNADDRLGDTSPVDAHPGGASPYGLLDMAGNVYEWTCSLFNHYPFDAKDGRENLAAAGGPRMLRGGSFGHYPRGVRCAYRYYIGPGNCSWLRGFRVVLASPG